MDYLQYMGATYTLVTGLGGFKPYYKWITFNTWEQHIH